MAKQRERREKLNDDELLHIVRQAGSVNQLDNYFKNLARVRLYTKADFKQRLIDEKLYTPPKKDEEILEEVEKTGVVISKKYIGKDSELKEKIEDVKSRIDNNIRARILELTKSEDGRIALSAIDQFNKLTRNRIAKDEFSPDAGESNEDIKQSSQLVRVALNFSTYLHIKQLFIFNSILNSKAKFHIINASRQAGKTHLLVYLAWAYSSILTRANIMIISPTYSQVDIIFQRLVSDTVLNSAFSDIKNSSPKQILNKHTGSTILFRSADRPDSLRGNTNTIVLMDEYAFMKDDLLDKVVRPTTATRSESKIIAVSTPFGKTNDFYKLYETSFIDDNYKYYTMHYSDNPVYDLSEVESAKQRLPQAIYLQEYEGEFINETGGVFENIDKVAILNNYPAFDVKNRYFAGIDWGRSNDKTVLTIINKDKQVVFCRPFLGDWNHQVKDLGVILNKYKPITYVETNGIGDPLFSQLRAVYGNIKEFVTSNASKKNIIEQLKYDIFVENIKLPSVTLNTELIKELGSYTYSISSSGNIIYKHPDNGHDDFVDSLAFANFAHSKHNASFTVPQFTGKSDFLK